MKNILGLDLGTNSIGWAIIDADSNKIIKSGSRIIPMDAESMSDFQKGNLHSAASKRTQFRGIRRLYQRAELRRERLLRVLNVLGFLPEHYREQIDFAEHPGQFINDAEPLLAYRKNQNGKNEFIFMDSFNEMLDDFRRHHPELVADGRKISYDWTIYYLRTKALTQPISRAELAWIILNFNTKRGYYQLRGEEDKFSSAKNEEYEILEVTDVIQQEPDKRHKNQWKYCIIYDNGARQYKSGVAAPYKAGDKIEAIVTTTYDKNGNIALDKEGFPKISVREPKDDEWILKKKRTEKNLEKSGKTVGAFIYESLLTQPNQKIRGKLVHTIERKYYKDELIAILNKQCEYIPELNDYDLYMACVRELYRSNIAHVASLEKGNFTRLFIDDIIFYQRPLKSKKDTIANCPHEHYCYIDKEIGEIKEKPIKVVAKSHPLYQEFRLWQFVQNLKIFQREKTVNGKLKLDVDVTDKCLKDKAEVFDYLYELESIRQKKLLAYLGLNETEYRWNYTEDKPYPCNETHCSINNDNKLTINQEIELWHILDSVDDPLLLRKALTTFAKKNLANNQEDDEYNEMEVNEFVESHVHIKPFNNDYGAYSLKSLKRLLPLMRTGKYWKAEDIDKNTLNRIDRIIRGEGEDYIMESANTNRYKLEHINDFQSLPVWLAEYVVYGRKENFDVWKTPNDIDYFLKYNFRQNPLRNPVVESVISETLRVVKDIWSTYGKIDEVHVEMGRDLKQSADKRKKDLERMLKNEQTNQRIRVLLQELANEAEDAISNVRHHSPSQLELLKIYETDVLAHHPLPEEYENTVKNMGKTKAKVTSSEIKRYWLWLDQKYRSPYTGDPIPLSKLFTSAYEIEHIIPQSRYFDDSLTNKVICESEVNKLKDNMLAYEFISSKHGEIVGKHKILSLEQYENIVKETYGKNPAKMRKLLMEDIPKTFIERQLNDSRYIARKTCEILSCLVRRVNADGTVDKKDKGNISVNVIAPNGHITDRLKREWGINQVWNHIITPRFERLNQITNSTDYGKWVEDSGKRYFQINIPTEIAEGFSKKRIDHRHHAMDAIVIACTTRDHINYLNNSNALSSKEKERYDLKHKLCYKDKTDAYGNYVWTFNKPWQTFTQDVEAELRSIIVSFKQNLRIANRTTNYYWHYKDGKRVLDKQTKGESWAIRQSLHKATVSGAVRIQEKKMVNLKVALNDWHKIVDKRVRKAIKEVIALYNGKCDSATLLKYFKDKQYQLADGHNINRVEIYVLPEEPNYTVSRTLINDKFEYSDIAKIADAGIRTILTNYLKAHDNNPKIAFTPEGITEMNRDIRKYNNGKDHKPIYSVSKKEALGMKFKVGYRGNKQSKYVEADKGTNLFYAVYEDNNGKRSYTSIPFRDAVECQKMKLPLAPEFDSQGNKLLFILSPGDLVYIPETDGLPNVLSRDRIYKLVSVNKKQSFFIPYNISVPIVDTIELGANNKAERAWTDEIIKKVCIPLQINRLGIICKKE